MCVQPVARKHLADSHKHAGTPTHTDTQTHSGSHLCRCSTAGTRAHTHSHARTLKSHLCMLSTAGIRTRTLTRTLPVHVVYGAQQLVHEQLHLLLGQVVALICNHERTRGDHVTLRTRVAMVTGSLGVTITVTHSTERKSRHKLRNSPRPKLRGLSHKLPLDCDEVVSFFMHRRIFGPARTVLGRSGDLIFVTPQAHKAPGRAKPIKALQSWELPVQRSV